MLTYHFRDLSEIELGLLEHRLGHMYEGVIYDLLCDENGEWDCMVINARDAEFREFLEKIGVSQW